MIKYTRKHEILNQHFIFYGYLYSSRAVPEENIDDIYDKIPTIKEWATVVFNIKQNN